MAKAARIGDLSDHPGGMVGGPLPLVSKVWIEGALAAVEGDAHTCKTIVPPPHLNSSLIMTGSEGVFICGKGAARVGDAAGCGAKITKGALRTEVG